MMTRVHELIQQLPKPVPGTAPFASPRSSREVLSLDPLWGVSGIRLWVVSTLPFQPGVSGNPASVKSTVPKLQVSRNKLQMSCKQVAHDRNCHLTFSAHDRNCHLTFFSLLPDGPQTHEDQVTSPIPKSSTYMTGRQRHSLPSKLCCLSLKLRS